LLVPAVLFAVFIFRWLARDAGPVVLLLLLLVYLLLLILLTKVIAIWNAVRWLKYKGAPYAEASGGLEITSSPDLARFEADFFPFGLKDFRLHRYISQNDGLRRGLARLFQSVFFRFGRLSKILCVTVCCLASAFSWNATLRGALGVRGRMLLLCAAALPLVANALLGVEFIYSNAVLGGYAGPFHGEKGRGEPKRLVELKRFVSQVAAALYTGASLTYVAYIDHAAFAGQIAPVVDGLRFWDTLANRATIYLQCSYFSATTFTTVGYGDIAPANPVGQATAFLIMVQSFCLVVMVFASLMSIMSAPASPGPSGPSAKKDAN
jgi:hypothetical protein